MGLITKAKRHPSTWDTNPYLAEGEVIEEFDTGRAKIGPVGGGYWNDLPYTDEPSRAYARAFAFPRNPRELVLSEFIQPGDNGDAALAINRAIATLPFGTKYSSGWKNTRIIGGAGVLVIDQDIVIKSPAWRRWRPRSTRSRPTYPTSA